MVKPKSASGNYISEWFGQRIFPVVRLEEKQLVGANAERCPFLSAVLHTSARCVKNRNSAGVCTVNSASNGPRQDWLVCPYRVINSDIVRRSCEVVFSLPGPVTPVAVPLLERAAERDAFEATVRRDGHGYLFFQDKLGGEISLLGTSRSPELSFDVTLVEIGIDANGAFIVSRYGILEIQTMDYHGSYKAAVDNLRDGLRLHPGQFSRTLTQNLERWTGEGVEGPNIANVFKRTFYQTLIKFKLGVAGAAAAGTVLALPRSVWDSWQPFLGAPDVHQDAAGLRRLGSAEDSGHAGGELNAHICVFDLQADAPTSISAVHIDHFIRVSPVRLAHFAFTEVPEQILAALAKDNSVVSRINARLGTWWPAFKPKQHRRRP
jgi:hypothetical protein